MFVWLPQDLSDFTAEQIDLLWTDVASEFRVRATWIGELYDTLIRLENERVDKVNVNAYLDEYKLLNMNHESEFSKDLRSIRLLLTVL